MTTLPKIRVFKSVGRPGQWVIDWGQEPRADGSRCLTYESTWVDALERACDTADAERDDLRQMSP